MRGVDGQVRVRDPGDWLRQVEPLAAHLVPATGSSLQVLGRGEGDRVQNANGVSGVRGGHGCRVRTR